MTTMFNASDYRMMADVEGSTSTLEGDLVTFVCNVDGTPHRFALDTADAFTMGAMLICTAKAAAYLARLPIEQKSLPQHESMVRNIVDETMDVIEKHIAPTAH